MMQKSLIISITILFTILSAPFGYSQQSEETKTILILCALSPAQPAYRLILGGIRQKLTEQFGDLYSIHTEYLEIESYPKDDYPKERFNIYNEKYRNIKLDLLICVGRNAIGPIKQFGEDYLLNLPTISIDFDFSDFGFKSDLKLNEKTAVVGMRLNFDRSISTALSLFPETTSVFFVGGTAPFDKFLMSLAKEASQIIDKSKEIIFISDKSMDKILQQVHSLPVNSLIFVPSFNTDLKLVTYHNPEAIRLISMAANVPVFAYSDMGFGDGAVGGYILSFEKIGLLSGVFAIKILQGADPNSLSVTEQDYYDYIFDWRELKHWNLENSDLIPAESTILYEEISYFDKYKWIGGGVLLFIVLQTLLIANLIRLNRNQKLMTQQIIESESKYRNFLHQDRILRMGQITASLSHELNQPLTAILSNAQAGIRFIDSNESSPELLKNILQKIVSNDKRTASILSSIRGMLKLESKEKEKVNLNSLIKKVVSVYRSEAKKLNIKISVSLPDTITYVLADQTQIEQVILNFIFNASQAMEKTDTLKKIIKIRQYINEGLVTVSVRDNGKGIDEALKEEIFKPFITSKKEGMGIGLSICQSIIEDHRGKIWTENLPEGGAEFSFSLGIISNE
jgi:signal transduction histidine kinase